MEYRKAEDLKLIETSDGSHSLYLKDMNETYHSFKGAVQESDYVFIKQGLEYLAASLKEIKVLEVGFGTGLNALLTYLYSKNHGLDVSFHTLEPFPLPESIIQKLNYADLISDRAVDFFQQIHQAEWDKETRLSPNFSLLKSSCRLQELDVPQESFDLVYFDAFAPNKQADVWASEVLGIVKKALKKGGILTTYCASGQFKRNLHGLGFEVETLPGPPGKKEMTRAAV